MFQSLNLLTVSQKRLKPHWPQIRLILDETLNTVTHGLGLFIAGFALTVVWGCSHVGCLVYLASAISVYLFSTLSHGIPGRRRARLRALDQGCIFLMIAGTYTPIILTYANNYQGHILLGEIWTAAVIGFALKTTYRMKSIVPYVVLGWCPCLCHPWVLASAPYEVIALIVLGGLAYSAGIYFFLKDHRFGFHALWHLFVIAGSAFHFAAIYTMG